MVTKESITDGELDVIVGVLYPKLVAEEFQDSQSSVTLFLIPFSK